AIVDEFELPISADLDCAPNRWDITAAVPGCEYVCVFESPVDPCDGQDDDCDGPTSVDEDFDPSVCGVGRCAALAACIAGDVVCGAAAASDETCDDEDDNCDGQSDEEYVGYTCGTGACATVSTCVAGVVSCTPASLGAEACDGVDNDCDGVVDDGCDDDLDGYCDVAMTLVGEPAVCPSGGGDCDDNPAADGAARYPGAGEACDDEDDDCDGDADNGCDDDGDGYCDAAMTLVGVPDACPSGGDDCDDENEDIRPGVVEGCNDVDDDCDVTVDEGCDDDGDGFCDAAMPLVGAPDACPGGGGDCRDLNPAIHPGVGEICDGIDNDCDAALDEGCDDDDDGWCDGAMAVV
ncbi:MAG: putative metal-binding motif-containing protein, partial [Deltaproteobacteria bacterium]